MSAVLDQAIHALMQRVSEQAILPRYQALDLADIGRRQGSSRFAQCRRGDRAAFRHDVFPDGEAKARLLFVAREGEIGVEDVLRSLRISLIAIVNDVAHHFGIGKAGHRTVCPAGHLFGQEDAAIAAQD